MRNACMQALLEAAVKNEKIFFITGDLGYGVVESFREKNPDRFLNLGVQEQNIMGFAAGMALSGKIPVVYSIATFITLRCFEQIRNDICYQNLNVKIIGVGSGLTYSQYGATHHSTEDIGIMRILPNMSVVCPGDPIETKNAVFAMLDSYGPFYLRIASRGEPNIHEENVRFALGKGI